MPGCDVKIRRFGDFQKGWWWFSAGEIQISSSIHGPIIQLLGWMVAFGFS